MKVSKAFTFAAATYFGLVFVKNGTLVRLIDDGSRGLKTLTRGSKSLTRLT